MTRERSATELGPEVVQAALEAQAWTFAKTMPQWPHWYTLRRN